MGTDCERRQVYQTSNWITGTDIFQVDISFFGRKGGKSYVYLDCSEARLTWDSTSYEAHQRKESTRDCTCSTLWACSLCIWLLLSSTLYCTLYCEYSISIPDRLPYCASSRIAKLENGQCIIGMKTLAMLPLISFDTVVNVYLTIIFLIPLRSAFLSSYL